MEIEVVMVGLLVSFLVSLLVAVKVVSLLSLVMLLLLSLPLLSPMFVVPVVGVAVGFIVIVGDVAFPGKKHAAGVLVISAEYGGLKIYTGLCIVTFFFSGILLILLLF